MHRRSRSLLAAILILTTPATSLAWNYTGHRIIATIAYRQLDEATKQRVAEVLRKHPAYADLWANRPTNGPDEVLNLFWNASVFSDDARSEPWRRYNRPAAHYVNFQIIGDVVEPPVDGENILNSYAAHDRRVREARTSPEDRALHLSWMFHQIEDIHQPLHAVARFSGALPDGDRGGNEVKFPNPRARGDRGNNLHAYWDDLLGTDESPEAVVRIAAEIESDHPREEFTEALRRSNIREWARGSVSVAIQTVYRDLDPEITVFADRPVGYDAEATRVARRRAALAGYRLAEELKGLFAG